jgi:hypothetical protein
MSGRILWVGAAIAAVLLLLTALTGVFWMGSRATAAALDDHGVVTMATVESKRTDIRRVRTNDGTRRETDYLVTYTFEAAAADGGETVGQVIEHEVPRTIFDQLRPGQEVEIRYLPEDPTRADFYPGESQGTARVLGWVMVIMLGSAVAALGSTFWISRRAQGAPAAAGPIQSV